MTDNPTPNDIALLREAAERVQKRVGEWDSLRGNEPRDRFAAFGENLRHDAMALVVAALAPGQHDGAAGEGLRVLALIDQVEAGHFDVLDAVADKWAAEASVQRMANAMASVFEKYASQDIMDRFREKLGALMHLAFVEGAAQGVLQLRATSPSSDDAKGDPRHV